MLSKYSLHPYKGAGYFFTYSDFRLYQSPTEWIGKKLSCVLFSLSEKMVRLNEFKTIFV